MRPIPQDDLEMIRDNFNFADTDGNGLIDFEEFSALLRVLSPESTTQQSAEAFSMIDTNSDGQIDYPEFIAWWKQVWWEY
ncbi:MAG: EF-hand domain-containing protein [Pseudomonadota bacterium]